MAAQPSKEQAAKEKVGDLVSKVASEYSEREMEMIRRLEEMESKLAEAEQRERERVERDASMKIRQDEGPFTGSDGGWEFEVGPKQPDKFPPLLRKRVKAVDESEAIRWYCEAHTFKGKKVDPVVVPMSATLVDNGRQRLIVLKQKLGGLRAKVAVGATLTEDDKLLLQAHEQEILGFQQA